LIYKELLFPELKRDEGLPADPKGA